MIDFLKKYWAVFNPELMPTAYREGDRPLHDDWPPGFRWIPRAWSTWFFPMPPMIVAGNAEPAWVPLQPGYPLATDAQVKDLGGTPHVLTPHPIHPLGYWSLQSVEFKPGVRIPCYFSATFKLFGRRILFNIGVKPDVTHDPYNPNRVGDMHFGFPEVSFRARLFNGESV